MSGIVKVEVSVVSRAEGFVIHYFEENNNKHTVASNRVDVTFGNHALRA